MNVTLVHLADLHYRTNWVEQHGVVLDALFADLHTQISRLNGSPVYLSFSGDLVYGGDHVDQYMEALDVLDKHLNALNIPRDRRICVPGNHDISQKVVRENQVEHDGLLALGLKESAFNDFVLKTPNILTKKFCNYHAFEEKFAIFGTRSDSHCGAGWLLSEGVGVYCLNTALCSNSGIKAIDGAPRNDKERLAIETRTLQKWLQSCNALHKVLVMHHPLEWLSDWSARELRTVLHKNFSLCLSGHSHNQSAVHTIHNQTSLVECMAPPLFTDKQGNLGYALISISPDQGVLDIAYRQWTPKHSFVTGVSFSDSDDGRVIITPRAEAPQVPATDTRHFDHVNRVLTKRLDDSLLSYRSQPRVWVEPTLSKSAETAIDSDVAPKVSVSDLLSQPQSTIIHAPPQFGLTCLALYMARQAWLGQPSRLWIYLDARVLKPQASSIEKAVNEELSELECDRSSIACILLDSWTGIERDSCKVVKKLCELFGDIPIIILHTFDFTRISPPHEEDNPSRKFEVLFLWSLTRARIRQVVSDYNEARMIGEEDSVTTRVVKDLDALNLHRTPLNCLTLLKVSEVDFDESPVNRTEMIKRVLFLLFNLDQMPNYKTRPDLKDCEYVLGYFCETLLRSSKYEFTRKDFLSKTHRFCEDRFIDLDVEVVFDVLFANHILVKRGEVFDFRFTYWIFYFAAQRMHHDEVFANYILNDLTYIHFPEVIEFYTGIDRRREEAIRVLIRDIKAARAAVCSKCGFPDNFNPFRLAQWNPSDKALEHMKEEMQEGVKVSNLPAAIKDGYADQGYDRSRPYSQTIRNIVRECSLPVMTQIMKASSRALRNSDYVDPAIKNELLAEITSCWEQQCKVLLVLMPLLAEQGRAVFDGASFILAGDFGATLQQRFWRVLSEIPWNLVAWSEDDLFSHKMGPLLLRRLTLEKNEIQRHLLVLLAIRQRPRGWKAKVQSYIVDSSRNSFYLNDVYRALREQYRYGYASPRTLADIEYLIKLTAGKHFLHIKSTGVEKIGKLPDSVLPPREVPNT